MLFAAGLSPPKCIFAHGFVNDADGMKMSKSVGNVIDPHDVLDASGVDAFRWYLGREGTFGGELR